MRTSISGFYPAAATVFVLVLLASAGLKGPGPTDGVIAAFVSGAMGTLVAYAALKGRLLPAGTAQGGVLAHVIPAVGGLAAIAWLGLRMAEWAFWPRLALGWVLGAVFFLCILWLPGRAEAKRAARSASA